jgi:molybdate transport system permease protein
MTALWLEPVWLSIRLASITTLILLVFCVPLAWLMARTKGKWRPFAEALFTLPLVLPPTVLGFYLLLLLGPKGAFAPLHLVFSFWGLVVGSVVFSLPFVLRPLQNAFEAIPQSLLESAASLGAGPWQRFTRLAIPMARRGIISAAILGFSHTLGEFGVVLMIGGNIPGKTRVLSVAIFDAVEQLDYATAYTLSFGLVGFSFFILLVLSWLNRKETSP